MEVKSQTGFYEYLHDGGGFTRLIGSAFFVGLLIVAGKFIYRTKEYFPSITVLAPLITDPFTILATVSLSLSYAELDFMEFRLRSKGDRCGDDLDQLAKQNVVPSRYRELFGDDLFVKAWRVRLIFIFFFAIAVLRWVLGLKG